MRAVKLLDIRMPFRMGPKCRPVSTLRTAERGACARVL